jgi:hypothetical protein
MAARSPSRSWAHTHSHGTGVWSATRSGGQPAALMPIKLLPVLADDALALARPATRPIAGGTGQTPAAADANLASETAAGSPPSRFRYRRRKAQ